MDDRPKPAKPPDRAPAQQATEEPLVLERNITLHQLRVFKAVVDHVSFSAAALALGLSQPSVSYQVKELEQTIGMDLLDRLGKRVELTQAGRLLYGYVRQTLNLVDEASVAMEEMRGISRGTLKVGASTTVGIYVMPAALGAFKKLHPNLVISLEIGNRGRVQDLVLRNELDLAIVGPVEEEPDLVTVPFLSDELVIVAPTGHPLAERRRISLRELDGEPFIMREEGSGTRMTIDRVARAAGATLGVAMSLGSNGAIKHAVESGLGVAAISRFAIDLERRSGRLIVLDVEGFPVRRPWNIVHLRRQRLPSAVAAFIEFLKAEEWAGSKLPTD